MHNQFDDISLFCTVAMHQSFYKAARALAIPHSTVSRRIAALEQSLGQQLLIRTTRNMRLTEKGQALFEQCSPLINQLNWAVSDALDDEEELQGSLTLSMPTRVGLDYMGGYLIDFAKLHPQLNLNISLSNELVDLVKDNIDIAFRVGPLADSSMHAIRLWDIPFSLVAAPAFIAQHDIAQDNFAIHDLHQLPCAIAPPQNRWTFIDSEGQPIQIAPRSGIQVNDLTLALQAALNGIALAYVPNIVLNKFCPHNDLVTITSANWRARTREMFAVFNQKRSHSRKLQAVIDYVTQRYQQQHGD
ncbi:LysR family transcriptional regulator [Alteromonas sp. ASW11-36]|uniref:LysR family transcriptional regulator n=1 Tax=Alteromonas arenosi TaxID=3055817 RepID=A0ABT7SWA2_9ALTE|nr:LysR family transcriptional regulator [Alteromonas sp. ASW11-36]MDM7860468.1 LysR family transcriptional regulator [Alteromonas sp. ASW11-36]